MAIPPHTKLAACALLCACSMGTAAGNRFITTTTVTSRPDARVPRMVPRGTCWWLVARGEGSAPWHGYGSRAFAWGRGNNVRCSQRAAKRRAQAASWTFFACPSRWAGTAKPHPHLVRARSKACACNRGHGIRGARAKGAPWVAWRSCMARGRHDSPSDVTAQCCMQDGDESHQL